MFEVAIFVNFAELKLSFRHRVRTARCDIVKLYVLQSYHSSTFCKRKTRGKMQFWIEDAAQYILANRNEINSDNILPFIIFSTPNSWDGLNRLWRRCLLLPAMFTMTS